jgi:hypothetical protein
MKLSRGGESGQSSVEIFATMAALVVALAIAFGVYSFVTRGGGQSSSNAVAVAPTASPVTDAEFSAAAQKAAQATLLAISDLPAGWTSKPHNSQPPPDNAFTADCAAIAQLADPNAVLDINSDDFNGPSGESVGSNATLYRTESRASDAEAKAWDAIIRCQGQLLTFIKGAIAKGTGKGVGTSVSPDDVSARFSELPVSQLGDSSRGFRIDITVPVRNVTIAEVWDEIEVRKGRIIGSLTFIAPLSSSSIRDGLLKTVSDRVIAADQSLPQ